jgi:hypothetical protein
LEKLKVILGFEKETQASAPFHGFDRRKLAQALLPILDVIVESTMLPNVGSGLSGGDKPPAFAVEPKMQDALAQIGLAIFGELFFEELYQRPIR